MRTPISPLSCLRPRTLDEALTMLRDEGPLTPLAGCTDLYVNLQFGTLNDRRFVDLWPLRELRSIAAERATLRLGSLVTFTDLIQSALVRRRVPMLVAAAREVGGRQIQHRGTLGGNIANASPAGDSLPVLAACDAVIVLQSASGERRVPFTQFYTGYRTSVRQPHELITAVEIPRIEGMQVLAQGRDPAGTGHLEGHVRGSTRSGGQSGARQCRPDGDSPAQDRRRALERRKPGGRAGRAEKRDRAHRRHPIDRGVSTHSGGEPARRFLDARRTRIGRRVMVRPVMLCVLLSAAMTSAQPSPRVAALVDAVKPALPYPGADASGTVPESGGEDPRWFVIWPAEPEETRIVVRANPLHPDTQKLVSTAEGAIQRAVAIAERKAQAAYDRALDELKRTGKATDLEGISLEDEGSAGQRLDAELELAIEVAAVISYEIGTGVAPAVSAGPSGVTWQIVVAPNTYQDKTDADRRDRFATSEVRLIFGAVPTPAVSRLGDRPRFAVRLTPAPDAFVVVLRGQDTLLKQVVAKADWSRLVPR